MYIYIYIYIYTHTHTRACAPRFKDDQLFWLPMSGLRTVRNGGLAHWGGVANNKTCYNYSEFRNPF